MYRRQNKKYKYIHKCFLNRRKVKICSKNFKQRNKNDKNIIICKLKTIFVKRFMIPLLLKD